MAVSMRVMSAGDGYKYLLRTVAAGDGDRSLSTPLTRYYAEQGSPPGRWIGQGLAGIGAGQLSTGDQVSEAQLQLLVGMGRDPITGDPLGRAYQSFTPVAERIEHRVSELVRHCRPPPVRNKSHRSKPRKPSGVPAAQWPGLTTPSRYRSPPRCCGRFRTRGRNR